MLTQEDLDINAVTGLLKLYFRELAIPLIPFDVYHALMSTVGMFMKNSRSG